MADSPAHIPADMAMNMEETAGLYGPDTMTWRLGGEAVLLLGGGRAVLMQLAHPLVATGVGQHSSYRRHPWQRTARTIQLMARLTYGTRTEALAAARTINHLHHDVTGTLPAAAGAYDAGAAYHARDPELLLWVWATLIDTVLELYPLLVAPLSHLEREQYYREARGAVGLLGLPASAPPPTLAAFRAYMAAMLASDTLALTPDAAEVARILMHMPAPFVARPALLAAEQITIGLLPPRIRQLYGYSWDAPRQLLLDLWAAGMRRVVPLLPGPVREVPWARAARRRMRRASHSRQIAERPPTHYI